MGICRVRDEDTGGRAILGRNVQARTHWHLRSRRHAIHLRHRHLAPGKRLSLD